MKPAAVTVIACAVIIIACFIVILACGTRHWQAAAIAATIGIAATVVFLLAWRRTFPPAGKS